MSLQCAGITLCLAFLLWGAWALWAERPRRNRRQGLSAPLPDERDWQRRFRNTEVQR